MKVREFTYEILVQHHLVRAFLANLGEVAQRAAEGEASWEKSLRQGAHQLSTELLRHMCDEERILEALAHEGHAPSVEHLAELHPHHAHQRQMLASFDTRVDGVQSTRQLGELIAAMTHAIILDMEHEEAALFGMQPFPLTSVRSQDSRVT